MNKKSGILVLSCILLLAACGGGSEQKAETGGQENITATATGVKDTNTETETSSPAQTSDTNKEKVYEGTISGVISDSMCGKDHSGMGELGKDPANCTNKCVEQGAKYVLVSESGDVYRLSDSRKAKPFAGKGVSIEGHIDPKEKAIHIHSIKKS